MKIIRIVKIVIAISFRNRKQKRGLYSLSIVILVSFLGGWFYLSSKTVRGGVVREQFFYLKQSWNGEKKEYSFKKRINPTNIDQYLSYYIVSMDDKGKPFYSKKIVNNKLIVIYYFNANRRISNYIFFSNETKIEAVFYYKNSMKKKKVIYYDELTGYIRKIVYYRRNGKSLLREDFFDHALIRRTIIYYSNSQIRSETEYFEGRKTFYDAKGNTLKVKRFQPKRIESIHQ